jgi:hypothetical protein
MMHFAIIKEIAGNRDMLQVLAELSNKFMDMGALVGELMMAAEGTKH